LQLLIVDALLGGIAAGLAAEVRWDISLAGIETQARIVRAIEHNTIAAVGAEAGQLLTG
jgi:hypothetical protein